MKRGVFTGLCSVNYFFVSINASLSLNPPVWGKAGTMKIERSNPTRATRSVGTAAYARRVEAAAQVDKVEAVLPATVLGIPEDEFTPKVRDAIMGLMSEVDSLRRELSQTKAKLDEVEKSADQDQLLPLFNRRAFVRELTRFIAFTGRYNTPASLIYFDMNHMKKINDSFGHAAGDAALKHFADTLLAHVRDTDCVGRLGGDEFGVLLTHAGQDLALKKADILAESLHNTPLIWQGKPIPLSFSYGAFELKPGDNADTAIARADEAMYAQKKAGRNAAE
jgi:diguanylate cyclase (GGDEF)-like protein